MKQRDNTIDILRGFAIFTMIAANMAPYNYSEPHPVWFRFFGSIAAPMFVFLAGMMVSFTCIKKGHSLNYYLKRGVATITVAAIIDAFIWDIMPFITYDVLYIIGLSMPIIFMVNKLSKSVHLVLILVVMIATPLLHYFWGYAQEPIEYEFSAVAINEISSATLLKQFIIEGWFPFFPWIGVSLFGSFIGRIKFVETESTSNSKLIKYGFICLGIGLIGWLIFSPVLTSNDGFADQYHNAKFWEILITREGYSELFYPPTIFFFGIYLGLIILALVFLTANKTNNGLNWLSVFGRSSMLVYLLHTILISFIFSKESFAGISMGPFSLLGFVLIFLIHASLLWIICFIVQKTKKDKQLPFIVNFIFGG